jgi:flagellar biosynthetic protein FliQ
VLLVTLVVAMVVSLLPAATQVQEHTLSFVPKIIATLLAILLVGPWMLTRLLEFSRRMFSGGP